MASRKEEKERLRQERVQAEQVAQSSAKRRLMLGYLVWFVMLFGKGVAAAHRLSLPRSLAAGTVGFVVYQLVFLIFNR